MKNLLTSLAVLSMSATVASAERPVTCFTEFTTPMIVDGKIVIDTVETCYTYISSDKSPGYVEPSPEEITDYYERKEKAEGNS